MSRASATERGDEPARLFDSLFAAHHEAVFRYCIRRLGLPEAEDAVSDVFAIAWRRLDQVPSGDATRAWLIGVAYKVVGNRYRSRRRRARLSQRIESEHKAQKEDFPTPEADTQLIHVALAKLSTTDQELIRMSSWDGLGRSEIGEILGIRVNAVDQRLHRARTRLKTQFDQLVSGNQASRPEEASI